MKRKITKKSKVKTKFIFVVGGVMSGIGKGITTSSIGRVLKDYGYSVTAMKIDPYLNVDAGTLNPIVHGEVFVTDDGTEADQDLGNYERFLDSDMGRENIMTSGLVYQTVIQKERNLAYGGNDVEMMSEVPKEIIDRFYKLATKSECDFVIVEVGGTAGDAENIVFLEAARIMKLQNPSDIMFVLVSYFPVLQNTGEMKSKPTQHAVRALSSMGINTDMIVARAQVPIDAMRKEKLSRMCNIHAEDVISAPDVQSIYEVPLNFERDHIGRNILKKFNLKIKKHDSSKWQKLVESISKASRPVRIGIVGKYFVSGDFSLTDSYLSVIEAVKHASWSLGYKPVIEWIDSVDYEKDPSILKELKNYNGIIAPGGFGARGIEGKIKTVQYCRENNIPYLGLCYGLQIAVIEFSRNVLELKNANTTEIEPNCINPVINTMEDQKEKIAKGDMGGSMRLGSYDCKLKPNSKVRKLYGAELISERHRHRYEVNNMYVEQLHKAGLEVSGINPQCNLVETIELPKHKFFVGTQFHPELKSRPLNPHPLFLGFIEACIK